jgi:outer membrane autotransporter protein
MAVYDVALKSLRIVYGRLDTIRSTSSLTPPASGSPGNFNRVWVGVFGSFANHDNENGVFGYKYRSGVLSLGYDRYVEFLPGLVFGISSFFSFGKLENNNNLAKTYIRTAGFALYGSYNSRNGFFVDSSVSYARGQNDYEETLVIAPELKKTGDFTNSTMQFAVRFGNVFEKGNFRVIPSIGFRSIHFTQNAWTDKISDESKCPSFSYDKFTDSSFEIPLDIRFQTEIAAGSLKITPEVKLGVTMVTKKPANNLIIRFKDVEDGGYATIYGANPKNAYFQGGMGVKVESQSSFDVFFNYEINTAKSFLDHKVSVGIGFDF